MPSTGHESRNLDDAIHPDAGHCITVCRHFRVGSANHPCGTAATGSKQASRAAGATGPAQFNRQLPLRNLPTPVANHAEHRSRKPDNRQKPQGPDTRSAIRSRTNLVIVPVTVKNRDGQLIGDLQRDEFRVFCDNVEQQIVYFTSDPYPLSAVVLIDNHLSIKSAEQVQKSLTAISARFRTERRSSARNLRPISQHRRGFFVQQRSAFHQTQAARSSATVTRARRSAVPLTSGATANGRSLETGAPTTGGVQQEKETTDLDDAVYAAGEMLKGRGRDRRKIIFLISDGNNSHDNEHSLDQATADLAEVRYLRLFHFGRPRAAAERKYAPRKICHSDGRRHFLRQQRPRPRKSLLLGHRAGSQSVHAHVPAARYRSHQGLSQHRSSRSPPNLDVTARQGYYQSGLALNFLSRRRIFRARKRFLKCVSAKVFLLDFIRSRLYRLTKRFKPRLIFSATESPGESSTVVHARNHPGFRFSSETQSEIKRDVREILTSRFCFSALTCHCGS